MTDIDEKMNRTCLHWTEWEKRAKELEKENAELRKENEKLNLSDKEMHQLWRALLYYWENKDFGDDNELKEQINMLREKMSDFMTGDNNESR